MSRRRGPALLDDPGRVHVLLVEDDPVFAALVRALLAEATPELEVEHVGRLSAALARLVRGRYDLIVTDLNLPDSEGPLTVRHLQRAALSGVPLVVLSGNSDIDVAVDAIHEGADDFVVKGAIDADTVARLVRVALERRRRQASPPSADAPAPTPGLAALRTVGGHLLGVVDRMGLNLGLVVLRVEGGRRGSRPELLEVAGVLRRSLRRADLICRLGPDELAVLLVSLRPVLGTGVGRLEAAVAASRAGRYVALGFAAYDPDHPVSVDELIAQARQGARPVGR